MLVCADFTLSWILYCHTSSVNISESSGSEFHEGLSWIFPTAVKLFCFNHRDSVTCGHERGAVSVSKEPRVEFPELTFQSR